MTLSATLRTHSTTWIMSNVTLALNRQGSRRCCFVARVSLVGDRRCVIPKCWVVGVFINSFPSSLGCTTQQRFTHQHNQKAIATQLNAVSCGMFFTQSQTWSVSPAAVTMSELNRSGEVIVPSHFSCSSFNLNQSTTCQCPVEDNW